MVALVEVNGSEGGAENLVLADNTVRPRDARRAVAMLKTLMAGIDVLPAPPRWDPGLIAANQAQVEAAAADNGGVVTVSPGLRSEVPVPTTQPATLAPPRVPLERARIALISAAGVYARGDTPFERDADHSFREVPSDLPSQDIVFGAGSFDHGEVNRDPNCMFPLHPLRELVAAGAGRGQTAGHFGIQGAGGELEQIKTELAPPLVARLRDLGAEGVVLTGG
jgi:hypothetical protein